MVLSRDIGWDDFIKWLGICQMRNSLSNLKITDLAKELEASVELSNRIVERYLLHQQKRGLDCGTSSAQDIVVYMNKFKIVPPNGCKSLVKWTNFQLYSAIMNGLKTFHLKEIEGTRLGINFVWWLNENETDT